MSLKRLSHLVLMGFLSVASFGCGDDDEPISPRDRCTDGVTYFASGYYVVDGDDALRFEFENQGSSLSNSFVRSGAVVLSVGEVERADDSAPLILKFAENTDTNDLLDQFANRSADGPQTFTIADGSDIPSDAVRRSDLTLVECGMDAGTLCAQLALDTTGEGAVGDGDEKVFAATGGSFRLVDVDNNRSRLIFDFSVELGPNILATGDASSGKIEGCVSARYDSLGGSAGWSLE